MTCSPSLKGGLPWVEDVYPQPPCTRAPSLPPSTKPIAASDWLTRSAVALSYIAAWGTAPLVGDLSPPLTERILRVTSKSDLFPDILWKIIRCILCVSICRTIAEGLSVPDT